ncbi:MAG: Beta-barrel assembly-enhancing protease [Syntrophus sp. SKADARSKE-3]|nr:Beta-barrel assembly-enhancing protease [Syntrophus sp. SKADARSKE-3]
MPETPVLPPEEKEQWDDHYEEREKKIKRKHILWFVFGAVLFVAALSGYDIYNMYVAKKAAKPYSAIQTASNAAMEAENKILREQAFREADVKSAEGRFEDAKQILMKYLARDPRNAQVHYAIGSIFSRQGHLQGAFDYMRQATLLKPDYLEARFQLANIYLIDHNLKGAREEAAKIRQMPDAGWQALLIDSQVALEENKIDEAIAKVREAETQYGRPLGVKWTVYLADLLLRKGNTAVAAEMVRKVTASATEADDLLSLAKFNLRLKDDAGSEGIFRDALKRYPRNPDILYAYGDYLLGKGKYADALDYYRKTLELMPNTPVLDYNIGQVFLAAGRLDELKRQIDAMLAKNARDLFALRLKVQYLLATGKRPEAIETMSLIVEILPYSPVPQVILAGLYLQDGQLSLAVAAAQKAVSLGDRSISPQIILANVYAKRGQLADAKKALDAILTADPNNLPAIVQLGDTYVSLKKYKEAEEQYAKAATLNPKLTELKARTTWLKAVQGNPSAALNNSLQNWKETPDDFNAFGAYINALVVNNRTDEAINVTRNQAKKYPRDWRPWFVLGDLYLTNGNRPDALKSYQQALALNPDNVDLVLNLCSRYSRAGFHAEMEKMLISARQKQPANLLLTNQLAWLYVETLGMPDKAKPLVDILYRQAKDASTLDTVGWYCYKVKDYKNAAYYLGEASKLDPENRILKQHLAAAMQQVNAKQ